MDETAAHFFFKIVSERYQKVVDHTHVHHSSTISIKGETSVKENKKAGFFRAENSEDQTR